MSTISIFEEGVYFSNPFLARFVILYEGYLLV